MGFLGPRKDQYIKNNKIKLDGKGNIKASDKDYQTSKKGIFTAGDMRRGQSLVVWAIREGRQAASSIDNWLMGHTNLPR